MPSTGDVRRFEAAPGVLGDNGRLLRPEKLVNTLDRLLGVEVEIAEWGDVASKLRTARHFRYKSTGDSSVTPSGLEAVVEPLVGDKFVAAMWELAAAMHAGNAVMNNTCGYHVHVNAKDLDYWALRRLLRLYMQFEPDLYKLCTPDRWDQKFCKPLAFDMEMNAVVKKLEHVKSTGEIKEQILSVVYNTTPKTEIAKAEDDYAAAINHVPASIRCSWMDRLCEKRRSTGTIVRSQRTQKYGSGRGHVVRYYGLNLHSFFYRGTIEFRMKEGTTSFEELVCWPLLCGWFVELCGRLPESRIAKIPTLTLATFAREFMPQFLADWVEKKLAAAPTARSNSNPADGIGF
jgi:hypothetical protein